MQEVVRIKLEGFGRAKVSGKTKFKWMHVKDRVAVGRQKALRIAGAEVRRGVQRSMSSRKPTMEKLVDVGTVDGVRLVAKRTQIPRSDKVTSWKTNRFPKGFLRSDIQYDYDQSTDSVVVGPAKLPKLNKLHEVGGTINLWFVKTAAPSKVPRKFSGGAVFGITSNRPIGNDSIRLGGRRVKARRYMETGLDVARAKIPAAFRDAITGP
jgi:hypothetical protein